MANTKFKVENGLEAIGDSTFSANVGVTGSINVTQDIIVTGNVDVNGTLLYDIASTGANSDFIPVSNSLFLGNTTGIWNGYFGNVTVDDTIGSLKPSANGTTLGDADQRWLTYSTDINASGDITASGTLTVQDIVVSGNAEIGALSVTELSTNTISIFGNSATVSSASETVIDSFPKADSSFMRYNVGVKDQSNNVHLSEFIVCVADDDTVFMGGEKEVYNTSLATFNVYINNANVELRITAAGAAAENHTVKVGRLLLLE